MGVRITIILVIFKTEEISPIIDLQLQQDHLLYPGFLKHNIFNKKMH